MPGLTFEGGPDVLGRARRLHGWAELSERQADVVALKEQGRTHQEIAKLLGIGKMSVDKHSERARRKVRDARETLEEIGEVYSDA